MSTGPEQFEIWAPASSVWSAWAKPSLFAMSRSYRDAPDGDPWRGADVAWAPAPEERTALIVDLPGSGSVMVGLALANAGYRPVPLYNCSTGYAEVVVAQDIQNHLERGAYDLQKMNIADHAPPAFLLDSARLKGRREAGPGDLDNRWMVFPQDFPSANFMLAQGIKSVLLVQVPFGQPLSDLAHVLMRWQKAGLYLMALNPTEPSRVKPEKLVVETPSRFRALWYRAIAAFGLRRSSAGGFGSVIPDASGGGGGGYYGGRGFG